MKCLRRQAGFTLIELTIGLLLIALIMAGVFGVLSVSLESRLRGDRNAELQQTARYTMDLMVREIQYAYEISPINDAESIAFKTKQFGEQTITYSLDKTGTPWILRRRDASGNQPVTGGGTGVQVSVSDLKFKKLRPKDTGDPITVGIELTVTDLAVTDAAKRPSYKLRTAVTAINALR